MKDIKDWCRHIPNALTILRFFLIPFIIISIVNNEYIAAFILLTLSGVTDILDGFIARKFNFITNFGKVVDPLADKATQVSILVVLALKDLIPMWILIVVAMKEFAMIAVASFLYGKEFVVSSKWYGKAATVLFYFAIVLSFAINYWNLSIVPTAYSNSTVAFSELPHFDVYIYYIAIVMTLFSLVMYYITYYREGYLKKENLKIDGKK